MRPLVLALAVLAASLFAPSTANAENGGIAFGVLTYWTEFGTDQVDDVTITETASQVVLHDAGSPSGQPGFGCTGMPPADAVCTKSGLTRIVVNAEELDDRVTAAVALPVEVSGGAGNDVLSGGTGADTLKGGDGDDRIDSRDGVADTVDCGPGDDRATVDAVDTVVNCEADPVVPLMATEPEPKDAAGADRRGPEGPMPELPSPVAVIGTAVQVRRDGVAPLTVGCAATETAGCRGTIYIDPAPAKKNAKKTKQAKKAKAARRGRGSYGKSSFNVAAGKQGKIGIQLTALARKALGITAARKARAARRGRRVSAVVTVVQHGKAPRRARIQLRG